MNRLSPPLAPHAHLTLRAHPRSPARVEIAINPAPGRALRAGFWIALCWGAIPLLVWLPPHYPWVASAFLGGAYLAYRSWTGRYTIHSFAGICPRCGSPLALGIDRTVDLPHTLTCFSCHFEPSLEVAFAGRDSPVGELLAHQRPDCIGQWTIRWLADEPFVYCEDCLAGLPANSKTRAAADWENQRGEMLRQLADEGWPLI